MSLNGYDNQTFNFGHNFVKSFIHEDGFFEDLKDWGYKVKGYGVGYSHPRHLNNIYQTKIKCFKDMDKALDEFKLFRCIIDEDGLKLNMGNTITPKQLKILRALFEKNDKIKMGITSISKKYYKTYIDFEKALKNYDGVSLEDKNNISFNSHVTELSANE